MQSNHHSYYLHHLGLSNWQLQMPNVDNLKLEAQYCLLPKHAKYIFIIASPFDVSSQLEQFLVSVAYSLKLNGGEFGYLIFNVNQNATNHLELGDLNAVTKNNNLKIIILAQESILSSFNNLKSNAKDVFVLKLFENAILQTSIIKKDLMNLLINKRFV